MLLKHYLDQGVSKAELSRRFTFTPDADGTYYIAADANFPPYDGAAYADRYQDRITDLGTYELSIEVV